MTPVTDPDILKQLNGDSGAGLTPVTDPAILAQLNGKSTTPLISPWQNVMAANPTPYTGYRAQVANAFANPAPQIQPKPMAELGQNYGDLARGAAIGVPSGILGAPGDIEALGRLATSPLGVSRTNLLPTTTDVGNAIGGQPSSGYDALGRTGGAMASPYIAAKGAELASQGLGLLLKHGLGLTTGAGDAAVQGAYDAGSQGGPAAQAFTDAMRGNTPVADVVQTAKNAVNQLGQDRSAAYRAGINSTIKGDPTVLDFTPIDDAIRNVAKIGTYQGKTLSQSADKVWTRIEDTVDDWRQSNPTVFHTPEGLDALKQKVGNLAYEEDLKNIAGPGTPGGKIVDEVYGAIKKQIVDQAPGYAKVMSDYSDASDELRNIQSTLSLNPKANVDTSLRKLQSIMRNNANTNYGARAAMGERLDDVSGGNLLPALAGQSLSSPMPRGLGKLAASGELAAAALHPAAIPSLIPLLMASSPRLVGEGAYALGRAAPYASAVGNAIPPGLVGSQALARLLAPQSQ